MVTIGDVTSAKSLGWPIFKWLRSRFGKPKIKVEIGEGYPFEVTEPAGATGHALRGQRIQVTNKGGSDFKCIAKIVEMKRSDGKAFNNIYLPVGLKTQHQKSQNRKAGEFNLRVGESKLVELAYLDETNQTSEMVLQYEDNSYANCVPRGSYKLKIVVYGGGKPAESWCRLYVDGRGYLKLVNEKKA
ncbi:MAG: hypothetical protein AB2651_13350 [Candidatus Thiodiazotropha sp.]